MSSTLLRCPELPGAEIAVSDAVSASRSAFVARPGALAKLQGYLELTKPRIALLELVVVFVAAMVSTATPPPGWVLVSTLIGTALVAGSASAFNQVLERATDLLMPRTASRPLPSGVLSPWEAAVFGGALLIGGTLLLGLGVNFTVAALGLLCWCLYVLVYTPLKARSPLNTVVGAIAGAIPALMGAAAAGPLGLTAAALFMLLYLWQFPHFMAIAWLYRHDYAAGGLKMMTVVDPTGRRASMQGLAGALVLIPVTWLPLANSPAGNVYLLGATLLGVAQATFAFQFAARRDDQSARWLLRASLVYLPAVLLLLLLGPLM